MPPPTLVAGQTRESVPTALLLVSSTALVKTLGPTSHFPFPCLDCRRARRSVAGMGLSRFGAAVSAFISFLLLVSQASALNVGLQDSAISVKTKCSRKCESEYCTLPPFLRYGKYCGLLYSGCPGEKPCDGLDACCMAHDNCIRIKHGDYLSTKCNADFLNCIAAFRDSGKPSFKGNKCPVAEVVDLITLVIDAALLAGRVLHKP